MSEKKKGNIHDGHRERLRKQFEQHGLDRFADHQALELLLTYAIPRGDVNPSAHELMRHFHSFSAVLEATPEDLAEVPGVGPKAALFFHLLLQTFRRYDCDRNQTSKQLDNPSKIKQYVTPLFLGITHEVVYLLCLDSQLKVSHCEKIGEGSINSANFSIRRTVELALKRKASSVVLAHNHPNGTIVPSASDLITTERLIAALSQIGVQLSDHLVVAGAQVGSLRDSGHLAVHEDKVAKRFNDSFCHTQN